MKKKCVVKIIRCFRMGTFPPMILLSVGFSYDELMKQLRKSKAKEWYVGIKYSRGVIEGQHNCALYREVVNSDKKIPPKNLYYLIFREPFEFTDNSYSILAHEVLHIVQFALKPILDVSDEIEAFAYTHTYVMNKCLKLIRKAYKLKN